MSVTDTSFALEVHRTKNSNLQKVDFNNIPFGKIYSDHMFIADFDGEQWTDFRIQPFNKLTLSPAVSVLHYGQSIFEGLKGFKSQSEDKVLVFRPEANAKRMRESALRMCMDENQRESGVKAQNAQRIDFILAAPSLAKKCNKAEILNKKETHLLSDHYPVMAEFKLND